MYQNNNNFPLILSALYLTSNALAATGKSTLTQPNIIIISCEDISPDLGCYGNKVIKTPNLDALANDGILFQSAYSTAGVSAPSRAALITGMYANSIGANNMRTSSVKGLTLSAYEAVPPASVKCYPEILRQHGYYCTNNVKTDYQFNPPASVWDDCSNSATWENRPGKAPFFSVFNITTSHESQIRFRINSPLSYPDSLAIIPPYYPNDPAIQRDIVRNYANITVMDREAGEIINRLKKQGIYDDAIIIFYSDHGGPLPRQKREIVSSGTHVPLIIKLPKNQEAGTVNNDLVSFVDIPPTILAMADIKVPGYMQGQVFLGSQRAKPRKYIHAARDRMDSEYDMVRMTSDKKFTYIRNFHPEKPYYQDIKFRIQLPSMRRLLELKKQNKLDSVQMIWFSETKPAEQLYLLNDDPHTINDVASDPAYAKDLIRLRKETERWMKEIGDKSLRKDGTLKPESELRTEMWPGGNQPQTELPVIKINKNGLCKISCKTRGASIVYRINENEMQTNEWLLYKNKSIQLNYGDKITVIAHRIGFKSNTNIAMYIMQ